MWQEMKGEIFNAVSLLEVSNFQYNAILGRGDAYLDR